MIEVRIVPPELGREEGYTVQYRKSFWHIFFTTYSRFVWTATLLNVVRKNWAYKKYPYVYTDFESAMVAAKTLKAALEDKDYKMEYVGGPKNSEGYTWV